MTTFAVQWLESVRKDGKLKFFKLLKEENKDLIQVLLCAKPK